jgi:hypothetical protein
VRTFTASRAVDVGVDVYLVDTTGGTVTMTLPLASTVPGKKFTFKKLVAANTLTVSATSPNTIDGAATLSWTARWTTNRFVSDGITWYLI